MKLVYAGKMESGRNVVTTLPLLRLIYFHFPENVILLILLFRMCLELHRNNTGSFLKRVLIDIFA